MQNVIHTFWCTFKSSLFEIIAAALEYCNEEVKINNFLSLVVIFKKGTLLHCLCQGLLRQWKTKFHHRDAAACFNILFHFCKCK